jgi:hypothetical protein
LPQRRASLEAAYEAQNDAALGNLIGLIIDIGTNFSEAYVEMSSPKWSDWPSGAFHFDKGIRGVAELLALSRAPPNPPNVYEIDVALKAVRDELETFVALVQSTRKEVIGAQYESLRSVIAARDHFENSRKRARLAFGDLIRGSIQEYLQRPNLETLQANLNRVRSSLDGTAASPLDVHLPDLCTHRHSPPTPFADLRGSAGCIAFQHKDRPYAIISQSSRAERFPLLIIPADSNRRTSFHSLEHAFVAGELAELIPRD